MTATTNGASLEDCLTNIFSLIDLNGIRWKRFKQKESNEFLFTPIDTHPVLTTYAKCIEENHIAVWRYEPTRRPNHPGAGGPGGAGGGAGSTGHSNFPTPSRTSNNNTPTSAGPNVAANLGSTSGSATNTSGNQNFNSNNQSNLELWIFGYCNNFKVDDVVGSDLVEIEDDSWEQRGLSYESRSLLFKALHNLIDRCLIIKGFTRIGRWFVQPSTHDQSACCHDNQNSSNLQKRSLKHLKTHQTGSINASSPLPRSATNLSASVSSAIYNYIDSKQDVFDGRQCVDKTDELRHTSTRSSSSYFTSSLDRTKSSLSFAFSFFVHGDSTICTTVDVRQHPLIHPITRSDLNTVQSGGIVRVALAPYGLNGILNGVSYKDSDNGAATTTFIQQWSRYYPLPKTLARLVPINRFTQSSSAMPTSFNQKAQSSTSNQFSQGNNDSQGPRSCLSNLTNMLLPPAAKATVHFNHEPHEVPPVVEVIVAGYRMRYPSECVFTSSRVVDLYKTVSHIESPSKSGISSSIRRPATKTNAPKPNRLSLLSEILSEDKNTGTSTKDKSDSELNKNQSKFNTPFHLPPSIISANPGSKSVSDLKTGLRDPTQRPTSTGHNKDNTANIETGPNSNTSTQTATTRYNSSITSFGSSYNTMMPGDLVKLFPTPPSLEQMIVSPSTTAEELASVKDLVPPSPATNYDNSRDNGIDVYKPVECAVMPPPPKWAALSNIVITSSDRLPPQCIYKGTSQKTSTRHAGQLTNDPLKWNGINAPNSASYQTKQISALQYKSDSSVNSPATPLTDQTNKKGFNMNPTTPKSILANTMLNSPAASSAPIFSPITTAISTTNAVTPLPAYTLPHQRLFNNLTEISSIQLNLLISDSLLGIFLDHNFENCTLCVCNMSIKGIAPDVLPQKVETQNPWRNSMAVDTSSSQTLMGANEYSNECTCGFSAMTNRHYSHLTGLFLEDELEITNVLYDPTEMIDQNKLFRKIRLASYNETIMSEEQKNIARMMESRVGPKPASKDHEEIPKVANIKQEKVTREEKSSQSSNSLLEDTKLFVLDQLKQQCSTMIHSNSSLAKVLMIESFRNNRHLTSCINYYAQATHRANQGPFPRLLDESNKYTQVRMINRNPCSLKFSDFCELTKGIITKLGTQNQQQNSRMTGSPLKTHPGQGPNNLTTILSKMFSPTRQSLIGKSIDPHASSRNNIFAQGLQALVMPTLTLDPKGALKMLEQLIKDESKEALATLNKAILIFSSPIHDWQFLTTPIPENNFDVVNVLRLLQPFIEEAVGSHNRSYKDFIHQQQQHIFSSRDSPTLEPVKPTPPCQGPLTWRQFHQTSGRGADDQCEPQPIPNLLTSYHVDRSHIAVSPFALKFWDKLLLEPYAPGHSVFYLVLAPDNPSIAGHVKSYFEELGNTYELLKMGKHTPIGKGILLAPNIDPIDTSCQGKNGEDWFSLLDFEQVDPLTSNIVTQLRSYAKPLDADLVKTISEFMDLHQPTYDPHSDRFESSPSVHDTTRVNRPTRPQHPPFSGPFSSMLRGELGNESPLKQHPLTADMGPSSSITTPSNDVQTFIDPNTGLQTTIKSQILINVNNAHASTGENTYMEDEPNKQTGIVIYVIDPFSLPSLSQNQRSLAIIGLIKCYSLLFNQLPDNLKRVTQLQLISLDSIIGHARPITEISRVDQLKSISMNIYSQCRKILTNQITAKSLTGFGPAAALEAFFKTKNPEICVTKMFTPPFILAPLKDKQTELGEMFGDRREKSSVIFCSYCITEDQRWLLASVTNDKGEMSESTVINISVPDRMRKPKVSVRRVALRRLMEFIVSIMSEWATPWRLIIGKLGRVGHGELREWAALMSKRSLLNYSRHLTERCRQCSVIPPGETVAILSACLVSLEPDSKLRVMPDQFATDDRQASFNKCPLSTPEDASVTHILVFPTSASIQPTQGNVEDPLVGSGLDDDLLNQFPLEDGMEDLGVEENMDDLFSGAWDDPGPTNVNDHISSHHDPLTSSSHPQGMGSMSGGDNADNADETLQLLQQPLALGYYISTAKIGQMPNWFWSTCPHLRNSCPVFLKSALHIHLPCVQLSDDLLHSGQTRKSHQLDSNLTTDILRYVLEGYNSLSWLALNPKTFDRQSCLPVHMQNLLQLYHLVESFS